MPEEKTIRFPAEKLIKFTYETLIGIGVPDADALLMAESLIESDLKGVYSHGIMRLPIYMHQLRKTGPGGINPKASVKVVKEGPSYAHVDGDNGLGHVVSIKAMEIAIAKAAKTGMAFASVFNNNHNGAEAYFVEMASKRGMIGYCVTLSGHNIIAPTGGLTPVFGNNPFAYAMPTKRHYPMVVDMACSVVARGWLYLAIKNGMKIPDGWALDKDGNPTNDAQAGYDGLVLPFGGYKGYALTMIGCILGGVLSGASIGSEVTDLYQDFDRNQNVGTFLWALDISAIMPVEEFMDRLDQLIDEVKASKLLPGVDRVYVPGEKGFLMKEENLRLGVPITTAVLKDLNALGDLKLA